MQSRDITILEFPTNLGLKRKKDDHEPNVRYLPDWLNANGFHEAIDPKKVIRLDGFTYAEIFDEESKVKNADKIVEYAIRQSKIILETIREGSFLVILGGDCSILIGTAVALKQKGNFGLFFLDGHTDFITPALSQTAGAAGMDLAIVAGMGHSKLTNILNLGNYFEERNIFCVGNREYSDDYVKPAAESGMHYFDLKASREFGLKQITSKFLAMVEANNLDGFMIHFDADALNDDVMPAVDSRQKDGYTYAEISQLLTPLLANDKAIGIEIAILDPSLDKTAKHTKEFILNISPLIKFSAVRPSID